MDTLDPTEFASVVTAITSAFGDPTRRDIYLLVHSSTDGLTASEVASHFGLHANVARHHLDKLCAGGYLEISTDRPAGSAGRPSKRYRRQSGDVAINVPFRQDDLLVKLLGRALNEIGEERATAIAEEVGIEYGTEMANSMGDQAARSFRSALDAVASALSAHGFSAHAMMDGESPRLVTDHCPFGEAAVEHPVICAMDRGLVKGMIDVLHEETQVALTTAAEARQETHQDSAGRCVREFIDVAQEAEPKDGESKAVAPAADTTGHPDSAPT